MKKWIMLGAMILVVILAVGCQGASNQATVSSTTEKTEVAKEPYKIGAVLSVSGPNAPLGGPEKNTLLLEVDKINKAGGIDGHKLELVIEDDQSDPKNANIAVTKLIDEEKVIAVIGSSGSASTMAMKTKTAESKVTQMALAASSDITKKAPNEHIFTTAQSAAVAAQKDIDYMVNVLKIKKFAILADANAFGQNGVKELSTRGPEAGLQVVATESYKTEDTNMQSQLTKIKGSGAEALVVWGTNPGPAVAAKNLKELGMTIPYIGSHGISNKQFISLAGTAAEGVVFPAGKLLVPSSATGEQKKTIDSFISDYKAKYGDNPNTFAGHAYDAIHILAAALEEAGDDSAKLRDAIEATKDFSGNTGIFRYGADDHDGTKGSDMIMVEIKDGAWAEKSK